MKPRRQLMTAVALCGAGATLALVAAGRTWVRVGVDLPRPLPDTSYSLVGQDLAPVAGAFGLAGLAGLAGLVATRGYARLVVGVLLAAFGVVVGYASLLGPGHGSVEQALAAEDVFVSGGISRTVTAWWIVSFVGGVLLGGAGALTAVRGRRWPGMSRKYDAPRSARSQRGGQAAGEEAQDLWESLDHGRDPTA